MKRRQGDRETRGKDDRVAPPQRGLCPGGNRRHGKNLRFPASPIPRFNSSPLRRFPVSLVPPFLHLKKGGFSLLEMMIALFVLAFGLTAVMRMFPHAMETRRGVKSYTIISNLARERMEEIRNLDLPAIVANVDPDSDDKRDKGEGCFLPSDLDLSYINYNLTESDDYNDDGSGASLDILGAPSPRLDRIVQVKPFAGDADEDLKQIMVSLFWAEKGLTSMYQLVTLKARYTQEPKGGGGGGGGDGEEACSACGETGQVACPDCGGTGTCPVCGGDGIETVSGPNYWSCSSCGTGGLNDPPGTGLCQTCGGMGQVTCPTCGGDGIVGN